MISTAEYAQFAERSETESACSAVKTLEGDVKSDQSLVTTNMERSGSQVI